MATRKRMYLINIKILTASIILLSLFTACGGGSNSINSSADISVTPIETAPIYSKDIPGARKFIPSKKESGTLFASADGSGLGTLEDPASLTDAIKSLKAGDVLFLRGGIYTNWGRLLIQELMATKNKPTIIESYPGEKVIIDGQFDKNAGFEIWKNVEYLYIRNLEITRLLTYGVQIKTSHNKVESCKIHDNRLSAVHLLATYNEQTKSYNDGYNTIIDNIIYNNSDKGLVGHMYNLGDNADGISISSGKYNKIIHNTVYDNSDDGIDTWKSNNTEVAYNRVYSNGKGLNGNGNGIKLGGNSKKDKPTGMRANAHHNIVYNNKSAGFSLNQGRNVTISFNTTYNNEAGYANLLDNLAVKVHNNISYEDNNKPKYGDQKNNSWQINPDIDFISLDTSSSDFLKPNLNLNLGAFAQ
jgi:parallel beta-helix repeat protein